MIEEWRELIKGLSAEDTKLVIDDFTLFGTAVVKEINGEKRRIPLTEWFAQVQER